MLDFIGFSESKYLFPVDVFIECLFGQINDDNIILTNRDGLV